MGPGQALFIQCACTQQYALYGKVAPFYQADIGLRILSLPYWVSISMAGMMWTGLSTSTGEKASTDGQFRLSFVRGSDLAVMATLSLGRQLR
jgi:hypothetical protein